MLGRLVIGTAAVTVITGTLAVAWETGLWLMPVGALPFVLVLIMAITGRPLFD